MCGERRKPLCARIGILINVDFRLGENIPKLLSIIFYLNHRRSNHGAT